MISSRERKWVGVLDSQPVRNVLKAPAVRRLRSTRYFKSLDLRRRLALAKKANAANPGRFDSVETLCVLVGHTKSGGSLLGAMLDAHLEISFGDEIDVLQLIEAGFGWPEVMHVLSRSATREALKGRVTARRLDGGYSLAIGGAAQGLVGNAKVIGVSRAGPTTRLLGGAHQNLDYVRGVAADHRLALIHVVRAPEDSIAAMVLRSGRPFEAAVSDFTEQCERLSSIRDRVGEHLSTVYYEDLVGDTRTALGGILSFLNVQADPDHLDACERLIDGDLIPESARLEWPEGVRSQVDVVIRRYDFLARYADR